MIRNRREEELSHGATEVTEKILSRKAPGIAPYFSVTSVAPVRQFFLSTSEVIEHLNRQEDNDRNEGQNR